MQVDFLVICDSATVREGLLHLLGAPITRVYRPALPAPLGVTLAAMFALDSSDFNQVREITIDVRFGGESVQRIVGAIQVGGQPEKAEVGEDTVFMPFVAPLLAVPVTNWGEYQVTASADGEQSSRIARLWVLPVEEQVLPGGIRLG